jgi:hypothetical protein
MFGCHDCYICHMHNTVHDTVATQCGWDTVIVSQSDGQAACQDRSIEDNERSYVYIIVLTVCYLKYACARGFPAAAAENREPHARPRETRVALRSAGCGGPPFRAE